MNVHSMAMKMPTSIDNLREVAFRCSAGEHLPASLAPCLGKSLGEFLSHKRRSIEDALGLVWSRGGVPWWLDEAMRKRDAALRELAQRFYCGQAVSRQAAAIYRAALCGIAMAQRLRGGTAAAGAFRHALRMAVARVQVRSRHAARRSAASAHPDALTCASSALAPAPRHARFA